VISQAVAPNPPANSLSGAVDTTVGTETSVAPVFGTQVLRAVELRALTGISDRALRRNIERGDFENTLVDLFGEAAGRDFEEFAILSDANNTADPLLTLMNGWATGAANRVYGVDGDNQDAEFDPDDPEAIFEALLDALPKQYLQNRAEWRFYVPYEIENKYRDVLRKRGTALGDAAQIGNEGLKYKGIPIVEVPMLERATVAVGGADFSGGVGRICMLQHPDPWTIKGKQVLIAKPEYAWETVRENVNEGPAVIKNEGKIYVAFSAAATDENYRIGLLTASETSDLLDPDSWEKTPYPIFSTNYETSEYGPGITFLLQQKME